MGLDTTHGGWHGAYSAFTRWRNHIAEAAGYDVAHVKWEGHMGREMPLLHWGAVTNEQVYGEWAETPDDPLIVLLVHSDCEGEIHPEQAGPLADRLEALLPEIHGEGGGHIGNYRAKTEAFIAGLRAAVAAGEPMEFQ